MNIKNPINFTWVRPTHRSDGQLIVGSISYELEIKRGEAVVFSQNVSTESLQVMPLDIGLTPGKHRATVRSIETTAQEVHRSPRSDPYNFVLESVADPLPPMGLTA